MMSFPINSSPSSSLSITLSSAKQKESGAPSTVRQVGISSADLFSQIKQQKEDQHRKAILFKALPNFIRALAWPEAYNKENLVEASLLHLMQMQVKLRESLVSERVQALFLSCISLIHVDDHRNRMYLERFLALAKQELNAEQCRTLKLLSCLFQNPDVAHMKVEAIAKITGTTLTFPATSVAFSDLNSIRVQGYCHFTDELFFLLRNINDQISELFEAAEKEGARRGVTDPYLLLYLKITCSKEAESSYREIEQLRKLYFVEKNNFTVQLKIIARHLKQSSLQSSTSILYALHRIFLDINQIQSSISCIFSKIIAVSAGLGGFLSEKECEAIDKEVAASVLGSLKEIIKIGCNELGSDEILQEFLKQREVLRKNGALVLAKVEREGVCIKDFMSSFRIAYRRFSSLRSYLYTYQNSLAFLEKAAMVLKIQREALQKDVPAQDLDILWPSFHDDTGETIEPLSAELVAKEEKIEENEEISPVMPSSSSASPALITRTCMQQLEPLCRSIQRFHKSEQASMPALRLRLRDATYHLETFGATCDLFKQCLESDLKEFLPILLKRLVRNSAIMSEQLLTVEALVKNPSSVSSHSHLQMEQEIKWLNTLTTLEDAQQKRLREYLQQVEYGTVFHRYPHDTLEMYQYHRWPIPLALNWVLYPERTSLPEMIEFIENSLLFAEAMVTSPATATLSTAWKKELAAAAASPSTPQTLRHPSTPLDGNLQSIIRSIEARIKRCDSRTLIGKKIALAFHEVHSHAIGLQQSLLLALLFPSKRYLISHGDAILMNLQFLDEQLEMALHMDRTGQTLRLHHDLQAYRALRDAQDSPAHSSLIDNLNVKIGAQYPHLQQATNRAAQVRSPSGILWRLRAVEVSRDGDAYDAGMTPAHRSSSVSPERLFKELLEMIEAMCEITRIRLA